MNMTGKSEALIVLLLFGMIVASCSECITTNNTCNNENHCCQGDRCAYNNPLESRCLNEFDLTDVCTTYSECSTDSECCEYQFCALGGLGCVWRPKPTTICHATETCINRGQCCWSEGCYSTRSEGKLCAGINQVIRECKPLYCTTDDQCCKYYYCGGNGFCITRS